MKTRLFVIFMVSLIIGKIFSQTDVSGSYSSNETWKQAGNSYLDVVDVQIPISYSYITTQMNTTDISYKYINMDENGMFVRSINQKSKYIYPDTEDATNLDTLFISMNIPDPQIVVVESLYAYGTWNFTWINPTLAYIILNNGHQFNIAVRWVDWVDLFGNIYIVIKENYIFNGTDTLEFNSFDAIYEIDIQPVNENGIPFSQLDGTPFLIVDILIPMNIGYFILGHSYFINKKTYISELSSDFFIQCSGKFIDAETNNTACFIEFPALSGINQNHLFVNQAEEYIHTNIQMYLTDEHVDYTSVGILDGMMWPDFLGRYFSFVHGLSFFINPIEFWNGEIFLIKQENDLFKKNVSLVSLTEKGSQIPYTLCFSPCLEIINDSISGYQTMHPPFNIYKSGNSDTMFFGKSPTIFMFAWGNNNPDNNIFANGGIYGIENEYIKPIMNLSYYRILDDQGNVLIKCDGSELIQYGSVEPGIYLVETVNLSCPLLGGFGTSQLNATFNIGADDASPPNIFLFQFRDNENKPTYKIGSGEQLTLLFSAADYNDEYTITGEIINFIYQPILNDSTKVFIKEYNSTLWQEIETEKYYEDTISGFYYRTDLSDYTNLDSSALDLKIIIQDYSHNTSEYIISPAILIDGYIITGTENEPFQAIDLELSLYPNPTTSLVNLQISSSVETKVMLNIYDIKGTLVNSIPNRKINKGKNIISWNMVDQSGLIVKPGVYFCVLETDNRIFAKKLIVN